MTEEMTIIGEEAYRAAKELLAEANLKEGQLFVVGCSTSEVSGARIGTFSSPELADAAKLARAGKLHGGYHHPRLGR